MLDSTDFHWTNRRTSTRRREFAILVAYGYTVSGKKRMWGVRASPTATTKDYLELLADLRLPGPPVTVVADDDKAIGTAVRKMWPARKGSAPFLFACEHHLRARAQEALRKDNAGTGSGAADAAPGHCVPATGGLGGVLAGRRSGHPRCGVGQANNASRPRSGVHTCYRRTIPTLAQKAPPPTTASCANMPSKSADRHRGRNGADGTLTTTRSTAPSRHCADLII